MRHQRGEEAVILAFVNPLQRPEKVVDRLETSGFGRVQRRDLGETELPLSPTPLEVALRALDRLGECPFPIFRAASGENDAVGVRKVQPVLKQAGKKVVVDVVLGHFPAVPVESVSLLDQHTLRPDGHEDLDRERRKEPEHPMANLWQVILRMKANSRFPSRWIERWNAIEKRVRQKLSTKLGERGFECDGIRNVGDAHHEVVRNTFRSENDLLPAAEQRQVARFIDEVVHPGRA